MKQPEKQPNFKITSFEFRVTPLRVQFNKTGYRSYLLEFCKGPQVFQRFSEIIQLDDEKKTYQMDNNELLILTLQSEKACICEWAVYRVTDDDMKEYWTSLSADLTVFYQNYLASLKNNKAQYTKLLNGGTDTQKVSLDQQWPKLKNKLKFEEEITSENKQDGLRIVFKVNVKCQLDFLAEQERGRKLQKRLSRNSSKQSYNIGSKTYIEDPGTSNDKNQIEKKQETIQIHFRKPNYDEPGKRHDVLSDIIEASNQNSSLNHEEKGHGKMAAINQIPEEEESSPTFHPSIKTQNFDRLNLDKLGPRKSNTMNEEYAKDVQKEVDDVTEAVESMIKSKIREPQSISESEIKEDPFAGMETAAPHSDVKPSGILPEQSKINPPSVSKRSGKSILLAFIILVILGVSYLFVQGVDVSQLRNYTLRDYVSLVSKLFSKDKSAKAKKAKLGHPEEKAESSKGESKRSRAKKEEKVGQRK